MLFFEKPQLKTCKKLELSYMWRWQIQCNI